MVVVAVASCEPVDLSDDLGPYRRSSDLIEAVEDDNARDGPEQLLDTSSAETVVPPRRTPSGPRRSIRSWLRGGPLPWLLLPVRVGVPHVEACHPTGVVAEVEADREQRPLDRRQVGRPTGHERAAMGLDDVLGQRRLALARCAADERAPAGSRRWLGLEQDAAAPPSGSRVSCRGCGGRGR